MLAHEPAHHPHPAIRWRPQGIRQAHGIHANHYRLSVLIRSAAEAKLREADRLECEAWNAIMWAGGPAMPSPGESQAEPTIAKAIKRWIRPTGSQVRPVRLGLAGPAAITEATAGNPIWKLEAALYCEPCSEGRHYSRRQRAHILGLTYARPDPEQSRCQAARRAGNHDQTHARPCKVAAKKAADISAAVV